MCGAGVNQLRRGGLGGASPVVLAACRSSGIRRGFLLIAGRMRREKAWPSWKFRHTRELESFQIHIELPLVLQIKQLIPGERAAELRLLPQ